MATETSHPDLHNEVADLGLDNLESLVHACNATEPEMRPTPLNGQATAEGFPHGRPVKPLGYQRLGQPQAPWPRDGKTGPGWQSPKPLPKRPTGRFYVGTLLACICGAMGWHVWNTFFSVAAYGIVKGDTLPISPPWDGAVARLHTSEGQSVAKGDLLITLDSSRLQRKLDRLRDEVAIEQARLAAESTRMSQEAQTFSAQFFQMWATLQKNREELTRMQQDLERIKSVGDSGIISQQAYDRLVFSEVGQREFVEKTASALGALRNRIASEDASAEDVPQSQLKPIHARIDFLNSEIRRTQEEIREGAIRSPVTGVVARCQGVVGQSVTKNDTLLEVVDNESLKIELFVPQWDIARYAPGTIIQLAVHPHSTPLTCTVIGSRHRFEAAPHSIQQFYSNRETLMPIILSPKQTDDARLFVGSVTRFTWIQRLRGQ